MNAVIVDIRKIADIPPQMVVMPNIAVYIREDEGITADARP